MESAGQSGRRDASYPPLHSCCICCRGRTRSSLPDRTRSLHLASLRSASLRSPLCMRPVRLLRKADRLRGREGGRAEDMVLYLANSWRPSSSRREVPPSLAPSDAMRKWTSLNRVTWSSVCGRVTWSTSCQRSFTHTPAPGQTHTYCSGG